MSAQNTLYRVPLPPRKRSTSSSAIKQRPKTSVRKIKMISTYNGKKFQKLSPPKKINTTLIFYVNGKEIKDQTVDPEWTLLYYLRNNLRLCGTKLGCAEGGCGACTVMISRYDNASKKIIHVAANACLTPVCAMHGMAVTTVEGIGSVKTKLHPVQERLAKAHGSQCGFCTPGIIMSMYALLRSIPKPTMENLEIAFQGNLCRCTGYRAIIEGLRTFTEEWERSHIISNMQNGNGSNGTDSCQMEDASCEKDRESCKRVNTCQMGNACCKNNPIPAAPEQLFSSKEFAPYDPSQELIFPPKLKMSDELDKEYLIFKGKNVTWYRPNHIEELLALKKKYPEAKIIVGNSEVGVEMKFKHCVYPVLIQPSLIPEMKQILETRNTLRIGASVTLSDLEESLKYQINDKPAFQTRIFREIVAMLHWFAGKQIRNVAAIGGNIMTGSPISDLNPILMAAGTKLTLRSLDRGERTVPMDHTFFTGYRRNVVLPDEILVSITIPFTKQNQYFVAYKQAKRRDDDIAIVNFALNVFFKPGSNEVLNSSLAYGGMAPTTTLARKTCEAMKGKEWDEQILDPVYDSLIMELPLPGNVPGGMVQYRRSLTLSLFFKAFLQITKDLKMELPTMNSLPKALDNASDSFHYRPPMSSQYFQVVPDSQERTDLVGRPIIHASALKQATGEAVYCDDIPKFVGELYLALVLSTRAHARITKIDASAALDLEGVEAFFSAKDVPKDRSWIGPIFHDEELFISDTVTSQGQTIGAIVAVDQATAQRAARMVQIEYEDIHPIIVTIEDAIKRNSYIFDTPKRIVKGDPAKEFSEVEHILEGEVRMGGQEHFYLETHAAIAVPHEDDEIEIFCSSQHPSEIQKLVAHVLHIPLNRITARVKRMGGGFGGKESRGMLVALPVALAAHRLQRPVRCMLDRDEDMSITGTRHPFYYKWKVGFNSDGLMKVAEVYIYNNAGYSADLSSSILERAMFHFENAYRIPCVNLYGYMCKTNLPSNTAFRGFGGPQGMFVAENIIRQIADFLKTDVTKLSELNLYREGNLTHYNQKLSHCTLQRCWTQCLTSSDYARRAAAAQEYNAQHRYKKRGIAVVPTKFGIAFTAAFLNQGGALVHIYTDGSVLMSHGGTEMGQGLHTKMIQVASRVLRVNPEKIHIVETSTDKVPNTSATAASAGSDLNGMAVMNACKQIMERLEPIMVANPDGTWEDWILKAYMDRISLSATGFYSTPDIGYSFETNSGNPFNYFTYGVAVTEVEIDCLTGDHEVLRTDIVMDLGESLNPAIDVGQVEGGFVQGYGLFTMEELIYSPTGTLFSRGPGAYKIPGFTDIPQEFNVSLLKGASNPRAVYSSKAVGEPPLFLASSVFFAIKNAIANARRDANVTGYFRFDSPATAARIRTACVDHLTQKLENLDVKNPWNAAP